MYSSVKQRITFMKRKISIQSYLFNDRKSSVVADRVSAAVGLEGVNPKDWDWPRFLAWVRPLVEIPVSSTDRCSLVFAVETLVAIDAHRSLAELRPINVRYVACSFPWADWTILACDSQWHWRVLETVGILISQWCIVPCWDLLKQETIADYLRRIQIFFYKGSQCITLLKRKPIYRILTPWYWRQFSLTGRATGFGTKHLSMKMVNILHHFVLEIVDISCQMLIEFFIAHTSELFTTVVATRMNLLSLILLWMMVVVSSSIRHLLKLKDERW